MEGRLRSEGGIAKQAKREAGARQAPKAPPKRQMSTGPRVGRGPPTGSGHRQDPAQRRGKVINLGADAPLPARPHTRDPPHRATPVFVWLSRSLLSAMS